MLRSPMEKAGNVQGKTGSANRGFLRKNTLQIDVKNRNCRCYFELHKNCSTQFETMMKIIKTLKVMHIALTS